MGSHASKQIDLNTLWGGKISPFSVSYGKMMMWFFLVSDALTFSGLLIAVGFFRHKYANIWPVSEEVFHALPFMGHKHFPLIYVALMTFILIVSSVTMVLAVEAGHRKDKKGIIKWLFLTVIGGLFFLLSQVWEWSHFIHGSDIGAVKVHGEILKEYGIKEQSIVGHGVIAQWADADGHKLEYIEKLPLNEAQKEKIEELTHHLHHASDYTPEELAPINKEYLALMESLGLHLRLPSKAEDGKYYILTKEQQKALLRTGKPVFGANLYENEYGAKQYGQFFFFVTGFHGFHVFSGVIINLLILINVVKGRYDKRGHYEMVEKTGLYWHFVDLVWVFVFTFFYLV